MPEDQLSDEALIKAFLVGTESAFDILIDRYSEPLWRYAYRHSHYQDEPFIDDIREETLIAILNGLKNHEFDPAKGSFKNWAYGICYKICLAQNRKFKRREVPLSQQFPDELPDDLIDERVPSPSASLEESEESNKLHVVLDKFPPEDRQLISLALVEDMPYIEIAQIKPFDKYKNNLPALRQRTCRLKKNLLSLLKPKL